jgi:hypothetical protein
MASYLPTKKAWDAACHVKWIGAQLDKLIANYGKLKAEDEKLDGQIKTLETAVDSHTKDNRDTYIRKLVGKVRTRARIFEEGMHSLLRAVGRHPDCSTTPANVDA